jgi:large subunit ribosomal protein L10
LGLSKAAKKDVVSEIATEVGTAQSIILAEYRGLGVTVMTDLRKKARESGVYLRVFKNTLAQRAVQGTSYEKLAGKMVGPLIYGISKDPVAVAKVLSEFAKTNDKLVIKGGAIPGTILSAADVKVLATMPSRDELIAKLMGTMIAPVQKLVSTMNEVPSKLVRTLAAVRDSKEKAGA